jgi:hypothetical protein
VVTVEETGSGPQIDLDEAAAAERVESLLERWQQAGALEEVRQRTRTVSGVALAVVVVTFLLPDGASGFADLLVSAWFYVSAAVTATVGSVHLFLRGIQSPGDVRGNLGGIQRFAIVVLAVGLAVRTRSPATRAAWRYLFSDTPSLDFEDDGSIAGISSREYAGSESAVPLTRYVRVAGVVSAIVIVVDQGWLSSRGRGGLFAILDSLGGTGAPSLPAIGLGGGMGLTSPDALVWYVGAIVVGALLGLFLSVNR